MTPQEATAMRDHIADNLERETQTLLSVINSMPDDGLGYKPHERAMGFGELALHIAGTGTFFGQMIGSGEVPSDAEEPKSEMPPTTAALAQAVQEMSAGALAAFREADGDALTKPIEFMGMGTFPAVTFVEWHWVHLIHHRGQLATYLRAAGKKVPPIYGPSADVSMADMAQGDC